jgi:hypothetical protein
MMAVEHVLIGLKIGIMLLVDDVPKWMRESLARDKVRAEQERLHSVLDRENAHDASRESRRNQRDGEDSTSSHSSERRGRDRRRDSNRSTQSTGGLWSSNKTKRKRGSRDGDGGDRRRDTMSSTDRGTAPSSPGKPGGRSHVDDQLAAEDSLLGQGDRSSAGARRRNQPADSVASAKLAKECAGRFGFDPLNMSMMVALPPLLQRMGVNPFLYVPAAVLYFAYLQANKDRADRKAAIGIVSDASLIKLVMHDLPRWVSDSEHQRVEWLNSVVSKLWPQISQALEPDLKQIVQEILNEEVLAVRMHLKVRRFTLGNISPKIVSVRFHETKESIVRLDIEVRWAGEPIVTISMGSGMFSPSAELAEFRLSAMIRIELQDFTPALPCFRSIAVTCMHNPEVHFSLKVAKLDFMNMGPADFSVAAIVRSVINSVLAEIVVYPQKMMFPIMEDADLMDKADDGQEIAGMAGASAAGVLYLTFERAVNLKKANWFSCNPHIYAESDRSQTFRSKTVHGSSNPEWGETFELLVFDKKNQRVEIEVLDKKAPLGRATFEISQVKSGENASVSLQLEDGDGGELDISYEYIPLKYDDLNDEDSDSDNDDILFSLKKSDLESDVLCNNEEEILGLQEHHDRVKRRTKLLSPRSKQQAQDASDTPTSPAPTSPAPTSPDGDATPASKRRSSYLGAGKRVVSQTFAAKYSVGILSISLIHVRGLHVGTLLFQAALKPYVVLSVDDKVKRTKPVSGTTFPHYAESFSFILKDLTERELHVQVMNKLSMRHDKLLGTAKVPLSDVVSSGGVLEQEYILHGSQSECYVGLRLEVTASS